MSHDLERVIEHGLDELAVGDALIIRRMRDGYQVGRLSGHVWQRAGERELHNRGMDKSEGAA